MRSLSMCAVVFVGLVTLAGCSEPDSTAGGPHDDMDESDLGVDPISDVEIDLVSDLEMDLVLDAPIDGEEDLSEDLLWDVPSDIDLEPDAEPTVPLEGFGAISGQCGVLDAEEIYSTSSFVFLNHIGFGTDPYDEGDLELLSEGGQVVATTPNAGGNSLLSEVFAYEVLYRCELADLVKTETEVDYTVEDTSITDLLVEIDGEYIGVSVTRAVSWPRDAEYSVEQAQSLLTRKLEGIIESTANVSEEDAWVKQILHVIAYNEQHAESMQTAFGLIGTDIRTDTILMLTVSDGDDDFLYE